MIRIGILGYGNLGRGVEQAIKNNPDMELVAIFTRRNPVELARDKAVNVSEIYNHNNKYCYIHKYYSCWKNII